MGGSHPACPTCSPGRITVSHHFKVHFTLQEARARLSRLRRAFQELHDLADSIKAISPRHTAARSAADGNGGSATGSGSYMEANQRFQAILAELEEEGIQVKDVQRGLVDFPHLRDGREVLLCWQLGEDTISYWHEIETGFAGRRLLE